MTHACSPLWFLLVSAPIVLCAIESVRPAAAAPSIDAVTPVAEPGTPADSVGRYEKFELEIALTASYDNPFDPAEIDLSGEFTSPTGDVARVNGFWDATAGKWLMRFAPTETGTWSYTLTLRDRDGAAVWGPGQFGCVTSGRHGFVGIAANRRYFQYSDGTSFYPVGLWYNDHYNFPGRGAITEEGLTDVAHRGMNFVAFYPSLLETDATGLGRYDADRCARLDQLIRWCEQRDLAISWNLVFHANISEAVWGEGNSDYDENPYRTVARARDYFASGAVWSYQQKLNRYIRARWGYSRAIWMWFVVDEINGCEGWTEGDHDAAHAWCRKMRDDFHAHDPYGRPTTGTQSGGIDQWWPEGYAIFDVAAREIYEAQGHPMPPGDKPDLINDNPLRASYKNYAVQTSRLWTDFEKPAIIGETGYDHTYYEPGMPGYLAAYHNALWATLANGGAATPFWWAYAPPITDGLLTKHVRHFAEFVSHIKFAERDWRPHAVAITTGDAWAMRAGSELFGWAANPMSGVARETVTIEDMPPGEYEVRLYRTWRGEYLPTIDVTVRSGRLTFTVPELGPVDGHAQNMGDDVAFLISPR